MVHGANNGTLQPADKHGLIIAIRIVAIVATIVIVSLLWQVMTRQSWQADCVICSRQRAGVFVQV